MIPERSTILKAENVRLRYQRPGSGGAIEVISGVSLALSSGEVVAIVGPSGSGKSCLLRLLAGVELPSDGLIEFFLDGDALPSVPMVLQSPALLPWKTVRENIQYAQQLQGRESLDEEISKLVEEVGLGGFADFLPKDLSGGMRARVSIARALVTRAPLVLFDEAFTSLDEITRRRLTGLFCAQVEQRGMAAIVVSHDLEEAIFLADRILVLTQRPSTIIEEVRVELPRPRVPALWATNEFQLLADRLRKTVERSWGTSP